MSAPARFLRALVRAIDLDQRRGYSAIIERTRLQDRACILAGRIIAGRA